MIENRNLIAELLKRSNNQEGLLNSLKEVNKMINKAANLRCNVNIFSLHYSFNLIHHFIYLLNCLFRWGTEAKSHKFM